MLQVWDIFFCKMDKRFIWIVENIEGYLLWVRCLCAQWDLLTPWNYYAHKKEWNILLWKLINDENISLQN